MYFTTHGLVGAALGAAAGSPAGAVAAGLLSHAVLDAVPHHDVPGPRWALVDIAAGALLLWLLRRHLGPAAWWGALAATVPDLEVVLRYYRVLKPGPWGFPSHHLPFLHHRWPLPEGALVQLALLLPAILYLWRRGGGPAP